MRRFSLSSLIIGLLLAAMGLAAPPDFTDRTSPRFGRDFPAPRATPATPVDTGPISSTVRIDDNYTLRPGDRVSYSVLEDRKAPTELVVMASGELDIPTVGRFRAANMTCREVAAKLKEELERTYYKKATVTLALNEAVASKLGPANIRIYFMGAVRAPGAREFPADGTITVSKAILIAGGFGDFADQKKVQLIRRQASGKSEVVVVNVADVLKGKTGSDPLVQAEDMIRVPEKILNF